MFARSFSYSKMRSLCASQNAYTIPRIYTRESRTKLESRAGQDDHDTARQRGDDEYVNCVMCVVWFGGLVGNKHACRSHLALASHYCTLFCVVYCLCDVLCLWHGCLEIMWCVLCCVVARILGIKQRRTKVAHLCRPFAISCGNRHWRFHSELNSTYTEPEPHNKRQPNKGHNIATKLAPSRYNISKYSEHPFVVVVVAPARINEPCKMFVVVMKAQITNDTAWSTHVARTSHT